MQDLIRSVLEWLRCWVASCSHTHMGRPFRDEKGDYQRCLNCGTRVQSKIQFGTRKPPWGEQVGLAKVDPMAVDRYLQSLEVKVGKAEHESD